MKNLHTPNPRSERIFDGGHNISLIKQILICSTITFVSGLSFGIGIMQLLK